jgi:hypothetical protein
LECIVKIVINGSFGGFSLSTVGEAEILRRGGATVATSYDKWDIERTDPILVEMVEEDSGLYSGNFARLYVVEVPDDVEWYIHDYDGREHVAEKHRTWR